VLILFLIFNLFLSGNPSQKPAYNKKLVKLIEQLQNTPTLKNAHWSIYAEYVDTGKPIISLNSQKSMTPGSGLKVFTTSTALNVLGPDYRYKTKLFYDGTINSDSTLHGNLYIVGGGDPTLGSDLVKGSQSLDSLMQSWATAIKIAGINTIDGSVIADNTLFDPQTVPDFWQWMDMGNYYGAGVNALSIHNNMYHLYFKPGKQYGDSAEVLRMKPNIPGLHFINEMKTGFRGSGDQGYIYCAPRQYTALLKGTVPAGVSEFSIKGAIPDPALFAAQYLSSWLNQHKIAVIKRAKLLKSSKVYDPSNVIVTSYSPPLKDIVYITNKKSDNLYAETLLKTLALRKTVDGSTRMGTRFLKSYLRKHGIPMAGFRIYDGCGLSRTDVITTKAMVKLLEFMTHQPTFSDFYRSLAIVGDKQDIGYFRNFGSHTILADNARIKSGLLTKVRSHSGYLRDRAGRLIAFSMIANNYTGNYHRIDRIHKEIMLRLAELH